MAGRRRRLAALTIAALTLTGCASSAPREAATPSVVPTAVAPTPEAVPTWPLTGVPVEDAEERPAVAVKVENTAMARPQTGLEEADVVWEEMVEGGITRFVAVDLAATSSLVEAVGGVQVCVEQPVLDSVLGPVVATAGTDAFNGARAATLVRAADVRGEPAARLGGVAATAGCERSLDVGQVVLPGRLRVPQQHEHEAPRPSGTERRRACERPVQRARLGRCARRWRRRGLPSPTCDARSGSGGSASPIGPDQITDGALIGFRGVGLCHATKVVMRALSRALPRRRALCTNWKKPR